jgi:mono/diheme cytochrome c family protein
MSKKSLLEIFLTLLFLVTLLFQVSCNKSEKTVMTKEEMQTHGAYLVNLAGCNDCHSPKVFTDMGPVPDTTKLLSGSPADSKLPAIDTNMIQMGKWYLSSSDLTAWVGPWGISYTANLTPDGPSGLGTWTDQVFIKAMRTGKHMGIGRPIMPPMPWQDFAKLTDEDLKSIFAYLQTLPPVRNKVPDWVNPGQLKSMK